MTEQIKEWLTTFSNQNVQIWCEDPETTTVPGVITKSYLTYRILMKQFGRDIVGIRHRYSEFEALRTTLKDKYAPYGILIPSLPPKNSVTSLIVSKAGDKDIFIKERTLGLTMFCEGIVASPWLRNDSNWKSFMIAGSGEPDNANNAGEMKLLETMTLLEIPYKYTMLQRMEDIKMEVLLIEKQVRAMLDRARAVQSCEKSLQAANEAFYATSCAWLDAERNGVKSLAGRAFDENESILQPTEHVSATLNAAVQLLNAKSNNHIGDPEYSGITTATILEQEMAMVESFKELFKVHEEIVHSIDLISNKLSKVQGSVKASDREKENEFKRALDEKHQCLTAFYKGFIYFSLPASAKYRAQTIRKLSVATAASHLTSSFVYQKACLDYFRSLNINPISAINETSRMLELLNIKQLEKMPEEFEDKNGHDVPIKSGSFESLFQRAVIIGKGKQSAHSIVPAALGPMEGLKVTSSPSAAAAVIAENKPNPLAARRGSAVMASKSFVDPNSSASHVSGGGSSSGSSNSANINLDKDIQQVEEEDM